jgi:hypothetical protein
MAKSKLPPPPDRLPGESIDRYLVRAAIEFKRLMLERESQQSELSTESEA